jgi:hypothetical protein
MGRQSRGRAPEGRARNPRQPRRHGRGHPPSVALARAAGLDVNRGIKVDDHMVTSDPAILAVGECVEHDGQVYGLVAPLWDMCRSLADGLTDRHTGYRGSVTSTKLKVAGLDVFSAGDFRAGPAARTLSCAMPRAGSTSASSSRTTGSSAPCSMAIPPMVAGISTCSRRARTSPTCATC